MFLWCLSGGSAKKEKPIQDVTTSHNDNGQSSDGNAQTVVANTLVTGSQDVPPHLDAQTVVANTLVTGSPMTEDVPPHLDAQTMVACEVCTFVHFHSATKCAVCHFITTNPVSGSTKSLVKCRLCGVNNVDGYGLLSCGHQFCRVCILKFISGSMKEMKTTKFNGFEGICCPECRTSLTRQDLRIIAGKSAVDFVDEWLCSRMPKASTTYAQKSGSCLASWGPGMESIFMTLKELKTVYEFGTSINVKQGNNYNEQVKSKTVSDDAAMAQVLKKLSDNIKDLYVESGGRLPYIAAALLCSASSRVVLGALLRNDSSLDIASRPALHIELFHLMRTMSCFPDLFPMICSSISEKHASWNDDAEMYHPASLMACLEKLHRQAKFILQKHTGISNDEAVSKEIALFEEAKSVFEQSCRQFTLWKSNLAPHAAWMNDDEAFKFCLVLSSVPAAELESDNSEKLDYISQLKPLQFAAAPLPNSHYFRTAKEFGVVSASSDGSRLRRIAKEIAGFATHLPLDYHSSIHVRVDEVRMDVLRALIVGPENTPYENGIFLFDILLPNGYPNSPPKVQFLTTAGGQVRFNPNLYHSGYVCLSLLGTWSGPGWQASASTLLQLLVSLQSLVFVDEPYYNEPGYENFKPKNGGEYLPSKNYNYEQCFNTLMHSMVPALRNPDAAFKDVIKAHFRCRKKRIEEQCERWSKMVMSGNFNWTTTNINNGKLMSHAVDEVKKELANFV